MATCFLADARHSRKYRSSVFVLAASLAAVTVPRRGPYNTLPDDYDLSCLLFLIRAHPLLPVVPRSPFGQNEKAAILGPTVASTQGVWPAYDAHETLGCQFTNAPLGFSFHAQTCSV